MPIGTSQGANRSSTQQNKHTIKPRLLNIDEAASYLGRTPGALRMLIHRGTIAVVRIGGRVQLDREDLDRLIEVNKTRETII
jgi:excisionase family DNA binding protein